MKRSSKEKIQVETTIKKPVEEVWEYWIQPQHITQWNFPSDEWCCPKVTNDVSSGGNFSWRMEAKDGSMGFDFSGKYEEVIPKKKINALLDDGRNLTITFNPEGNETHITETFEAEEFHSREQQKLGWQSILGNFKKYAESRS